MQGMSNIQLISKTSEKLPLDSLPFSVRMALKLVRNIRYGKLEIELPDGKVISIEGAEKGPHGRFIIRDYAVIKNTMRKGALGFSESYFDGHWESPDVTAFLELFARNTSMLQEGFFNNGFVRMLTRLQHWLNKNSKKGSERNIHAHYDLGNAFYSEWLDESMTYSSALFHKGDSLERAQERKYKAIAEAIGLEEGMSVLEIGCGWGGFAEFAAQHYGCKVKGLTISREQHAFATERMEKSQLKHLVEIVYQDYRDETGTYDRIVSIEMFEAVGEEYWPTFFSQVEKCLKPGGRAGLQIITIRDEDFEHYRANPDFIQKYVFPGGMLPPPARLASLFSEHRLKLSDELRFGLDYAETLKQWRERFWAAWPKIEAQGFDERFKRLWEYYLHYCEAGFRAGSINVHQFALVKA